MQDNKDKGVQRPQMAYYPDSEYFNDRFLNDLYNAFDEMRISGGQSALLKISIDNLPLMMSWYSLEFAGRVMVALKVELSRLLREGDVIRRISVDQLGVIIKDCGEDEVVEIIDAILKHINQYNNPSFEEPVHLRSSIGSVYFPKAAESPEDALNKAYMALSNAKGKTAEFYSDYSQARREHMDTRHQINQLHLMQTAFREDRMHLAFQPIIECKTGDVDSYECLLRLEDEHGVVRSAGHMIPIAEKMGVVDLIDQFVMERVVAELQENPDIILDFNVSNLTTDNPKWLKMCKRVLKDTSVASRIIVEITETAAQRDMRQTAYFVAALQGLGCRVALDDFGAGYTSFRQLKSLSVDRVKIDGAYVRGLPERSENLLFIKTLLEFNNSYGLESVAECVETGEMAKILMETGVDYMQGYYFGRATTEKPWLHI